MQCHILVMVLAVTLNRKIIWYSDDYIIYSNLIGLNRWKISTTPSQKGLLGGAPYVAPRLD